MTRRFFAITFAATTALIAAADAGAWHGRGHHVATTLAVHAAADRLPRFFLPAARRVAHCALDPDLFTRPIAPPSLHRSEAPEHYFDVELLGGAPVPAGRYDLLAFCARREIDPRRVGFVPYAVVEWTGRLTVALAEHRRYPDNPHIRAKCLAYAGILSHYAQDLCQPLHTTIHYDGRVGEDGKSPRTGIHQKLDAALAKLDADPNRPLAGVKVTVHDELLPAVLAELRRSHALVDRVYELEDALPPLDRPLAADSAARPLLAERLRAAVAFTAALYATAWHNSAAVKLPAWYARPYEPPPAKR